MVAGKCDRRDCAFQFDDADHLEDAVTKLEAHYRIEHPRKAFFRNRLLENLEVYNCTSDEAIAAYLGDDWREGLQNGRYQSRNITHACSQVCRRPFDYQRSVVEEVVALAAEHGLEIQDPWAAAQGNGNNDYIDLPFD